jgi:hypothetical protein
MKTQVSIVLLFTSISITSAIEIKCDFILLTGPNNGGYNCRIQNQLKVTESSTEITKVEGRHSKYSKDSDVTRLLYLNNPLMSFIPINYSKFFPDLDNLWIENCPINSITASDFENPSELKILGIIKTQVKIIDSEVFGRLENLEKLFLQENQIEEIHKNSLSSMKHLKVFKLSGNKLSYLPNKLFESCHGIQEIHASDNKLKIIDSRIFLGLDGITKIELRGNLCIGKNYPGDLWSVGNLNQLIKDDCKNPMEETMEKMEREKQEKDSITSRMKIESDLKDKRIANLQVEIVKFHNENQNLRLNLTKLNAEAEKCSIEKNEYENEIEILRANHSEASLRINEIITKSINLQLNLEASALKLNEKLEENKELKNKQEILQSKVESLEKDVLNMNEKHSKLLESNLELTEKYNATIVDKSLMESELEELQSTLSIVETENRKLRLKIGELLQSLDSIQATAEKQVEEIEVRTLSRDYIVVFAGIIATMMIVIIVMIFVIMGQRSSKTYKPNELSVVYSNEDQIYESIGEKVES